MRLEGRTAVVALSGGIACYKACEVVRLLARRGARVPVIMTAGGQQVVAPLALQTLPRPPVPTPTFRLPPEGGLRPLRLAARPGGGGGGPAAGHVPAGVG